MTKFGQGRINNPNIGELSNNSLATEKLSFWQLNEGFPEDVEHWKKMKYVGEKVSFGGLGESVGGSLATESLAFDN